MKRHLLTLIAFAIFSFFVLPAPAAQAHPLGNFTINTSAHLVASESEVVIDYAIDMAEIPTVQLKERIDRGDGRAAIDAIERLYGSALREGLVLEVNGDPAPLTLRDISARFRAGQAALDVLRVDASLAADLRSPNVELEFEDRNFVGRIGWREVTLVAASGQGVVDSSVPESSISRGLRAYPRDLLSSPPNVTSATATLNPRAKGAATHEGGSARAPTSPAEALFGGSFASLIKRDLTPTIMLGAVLLAIGFGALHALGPGHGKTVMAAYLVGAGGRPRHAITIGIAVSLMHTASVVVLGLITLWASSVFAPESVYPWLSLAAGVVVVSLGAWLLRVRLRARRSSAAHVPVAHHHNHAAARGMAHALAARRPVLAYAGATSAAAGIQEDMEHEQLHHGHSHDHDRPDHHRAHHGDRGAHARSHALGLEHAHAELPEGVRLLSSKGLGAIAISGGLLPSPSALLVLLGAVALHRVAFGIALVAAFSVGLAGALTIVGLLVLKARDAIQRRGRTRLSSALPVMSAGAILLLGTILTTQAVINLPVWT